MSRKIYIWQVMVTPHMVALAEALASRGHDVVYVAQQLLSREREKQGWKAKNHLNITVKIVDRRSDIKRIVYDSDIESIHICQGLRPQGLISFAQFHLAKRGVAQWVVMETVHDIGLRGWVKRVVYRLLIAFWKEKLQGVLAIGSTTGDWLTHLGMPKGKVIPFTYFIAEQPRRSSVYPERGDECRVIFVGQFIERKNLSILVDAISKLGPGKVTLTVVGSGPLESQWREEAESLLGENVKWLGRLAMEDVREEIGNSDCLVLPSLFDGWGVVVTEALMAGTPVICSDRCGAVAAVMGSCHGGVFRSEDLSHLVKVLQLFWRCQRLDDSQRQRLSRWARCLSAASGAQYLEEIIELGSSSDKSIPPPWNVKVSS